MKYFRINYKIGDKKDSVVVEAPNKVEAIKKFYEMRIGTLVAITQTAKPLGAYLKEAKKRLDNPIKNRMVDLEPYIALLERLSVLLDAGIPLDAALHEVLKSEKDPMLKAIFTNIYNDIQSGKSLYEAAVKYRRQLGTLSVSMFRLAEETGALAEEIGHLANIFQEILDNRRKFKKATRYPIFIIVAMSVAFVVVTVLVLPQFEEFFKEAKVELPLPTRFLLWLEHAILDYGPYVLAGAVIVTAVIGYLYKKKEQVRLFLDKLLLKIFVVGKATYYAMMSRFVYIFYVLHNAGIPMIDALKISMEIVDNSYIKRKINRIPRAIEEGKSLYQGFKEAELFESMVLEMVRSGEVGGGLPRMLKKINKVYKSRFDYIVENIAVLLEPILIAAIAGFVLTLALGIFLPMWNLVEVAG